MNKRYTLNDFLAEMPAKMRKRVAARTIELHKETLTLRELRKAMDMTQARLAKTLKTSQDQISRLEQRHDALLSTLRAYVEGIGGTLRLVVEFPGRKPVTIEALSELDGEHLRARKKPAVKKRQSTPARNGRHYAAQ